MSKLFNSGNGIMGSSTRNDDPEMTWLRIYAKDNEFYHMAHTLVPELAEALKDIAQGMIPKLPSLDDPDFRGKMWTWSQERAKQALKSLEEI